MGASALFLSVAAVMAVATSNLATLSRAASFEADTNEVLAGLVERVASAPYTELVANTFTVPELCTGDASGAGSAARSCVTVSGESLSVTWDITPGTDLSGAGSSPSGAASTVVVTASTSTSGGVTLSVSRTASAPESGWAPGRSTVRVHLVGDHGDLGTPLMLLSADGSTIVSATVPDRSGVAVLRAPDAACTIAAPCRIGLRTGNERGFSPTHALDAGTVVGANGAVWFDGDGSGAGERVVSVSRTGWLEFDNLAENDPTLVTGAATTGKRRSVDANDGPEPGSLCLWLTFTDPGGARSVPACNAAGTSRLVRFNTYTPDPAQPGITLPIPANQPLRVHLDRPGESTCPVVAGQRHINGAGGWANVDRVGVCSSWTWGWPTSVVAPNLGVHPWSGATTAISATAPALSAFGAGVEVRVAPGRTARYQMLWAGASSAPARGSAAAPVWSRPRSATTCAGWPTACTPEWLSSPGAGAPESDPVTCPEFCKSGGFFDAPWVPSIGYGPSWVTRRSWPLSSTGASGSSWRMQLAPYDPAGGTVTMTVESVPSHGGVAYCNPACPVGPNLTVGATLPMNPQELEVKNTAQLASRASNFRVRLTSSVTGRSRVETIWIGATQPTNTVGGVPHTGVLPTTFDVAPLRMTQGDTLDTSMRVTTLTTDDPTWSATGRPVNVANVPSGVTVTPNPAAVAGTNTTNNVVSFGVQTPTTPAGVHNFEVVADAGRQNVPVTVDARPGAVTVTAGDAAQGGTGTLMVSVKDRAGANLVGWPVSITANAGGGRARGVEPGPGACVTDASGNCSVTASYGTDAETNVTFTATTAGVSGSDDAAVLAAPARITAAPLRVAHGDAGQLAVSLADGSGNPVSGMSLTVTSAPGVGVTNPAPMTDAEGSATIGVTVPSATTPGDYTVTVAAGSVSKTVTVTVTGAVGALSAPAAISVPSGQTRTFVVTATDRAATPLAGAVVEIDVSGSVVVQATRRVTTGGDGTATITVAAPDAEGTATLTLSSGTAIDRTVTVAVD